MKILGKQSLVAIIPHRLGEEGISRYFKSSLWKYPVMPLGMRPSFICQYGRRESVDSALFKMTFALIR
jgi:hypothetical protein